MQKHQKKDQEKSLKAHKELVQKTLAWFEQGWFTRKMRTSNSHHQMNGIELVLNDV